MSLAGSSYSENLVEVQISAWRGYSAEIAREVAGGESCLVCGAREGPMVPCGSSREGQVFRHPKCELL